MSKKYIIIIVVGALVGAGFWLTSNRAAPVPTSSELVGAIQSVENNMVVVRGFYNSAPNQIVPGMLMARDIKVAITKDTKVLNQSSLNDGTIDQRVVTLEKLQTDITVHPYMLVRVRSNYDFYNQPNIIAGELLYTFATGKAGIIK